MAESILRRRFKYIPSEEEVLELLEHSDIPPVKIDPFTKYLRVQSRQGWPSYRGSVPVEIEAPEEIPLDEIEVNTAADTVIDIGESTPLLGAGGAVSGTAGTASGVGSGVIAAVGGLVGSAIVGGIVGGIVSSSSDDSEDKHSLNLPDHHFIGPGNDENDPNLPVDLDDQIAKVHDKEYSKVETQEDVFDADDRAIHDFSSDAIDNKNPHSVLGAIGLKVKTELEKQFGVQYPPNLPSISGE
uniref:ORF1 n=1 Tax=uncultured densovirus TaxID=748192 RepID=A0A7L7YQK6_9VIRU|nr:ORF1 [uncultured densovirus]